MKILLITQDFPPAHGGIQTYCFKLAEGLQNLGHDILVICPSHKKSAGFDKTLSFPVIRLPISSSWLWLKIPFQLHKILRGFQADLLLYGQWQNGLWNLIPGFKRGIACPQVCLVHGRELLNSVFLNATPIFAKLVFRHFNLAIPNSHPVRDLLVPKIYQGPYSIVFPGVDRDKFKASTQNPVRAKLGFDGKLVIGVIARLVERKNIGACLRAALKLREACPNLRVLIGGDGPELSSLRKYSEKLGLQDICHFSGFIPSNDLNHYFSCLDIFVMPSLSSAKDIEGFGIVYLEAACLRIPTVAYRSGGVIDAVIDGETGILVDPGDEEALFVAIKELLINQELRKNMGERAYQRAQNIGWSQTVSNISDSILTIVK